MRAALIAVLLAAQPAVAQTEDPVPMTTEDPAASLSAWLEAFRPRALAEGIAPGTWEAALAGIEHLPDVIRRDRTQNEFTRTIWDYLSRAVSDDRIAAGRAALDRHEGLFSRIEAAYGVDRHIVAAIWGLESAYGAVKGDVPTLSALATLAHDGRRGAFFEGEFLAALRILDQGVVGPEALRGSWAGAMGHTQFMPSSWERLAVDFTGDGRRDIWGEDPADALASTANYLRANGWTTGQPWGAEVVVPEGFDYTLADRRITKTPADWAALGVVTPEGAAVAADDPAALLLPAGAEGAAFLVFDNFAVLETYNTADAYVIAVGHLADRLRGGPPIRGTWPYEDRALTFDERMELQRLLTAAGHSTLGVDGLIGPRTVDAVRSWQLARGLVPDGYASPRLLERLRAGD